MHGYITAETSAAAVRENLRMLRGRIGPGVKLCAGVKADCYGHGLELLLDVIAEQADLLAVAAPEEAIAVRRLGCKLPVLSFFSACAYPAGPELEEAVDELVAGRVIQTIVGPHEVAVIGQSARRLDREAEVHVKIDTGMGRSGVRLDEVERLVEQVRVEPGVKLTGLYTHFATSDEADRSFMREQLAAFRRIVDACSQPEELTFHAANSAATIDMPEAHFNMVRPGLAIYGYQPSEHLDTRLPLRPSLRVTGQLMQVKEVPAGSRCGYGLTYTFERSSRLGRVPVGYGDGYLRCLSNRATVRLRDRDVPVRGRVSMDQIIIDVTDVPDARPGDTVEIISPDPTAPHSVANLARLAGTIPHEVACRIGGRLRRVLVE